MLNRIKQYRLAAGLTPQALSTMFKIPYGVILKWEKGELKPPLWAEEKIINALKNKVKDDMVRARSRFRLPRFTSGETLEENPASAAQRAKTPSSRPNWRSMNSQADYAVEEATFFPVEESSEAKEAAAQNLLALQARIRATALAATTDY